MNAPVMVEVGSTTDPLEVCSFIHNIHHAEGLYCSLHGQCLSLLVQTNSCEDHMIALD